MPINRYPREAEGEGRPKKLGPQDTANLLVRESPRVAIPHILLRVIVIMEDALDEGSSAQRVALKDMAFKLCQAHSYLRYPWGRAADSDVAQELAEEDGEAHDGF